MTSGARLQGADQLVRTLHDAALELEDLTEAEHAAGSLLAEAGSIASPRKTGRLSESHGYTVVQAQVTVTAATPYAAIVHARDPWLDRTVIAETDRVADIYLSGVEDALAHVKGI